MFENVLTFLEFPLVGHFKLVKKKILHLQVKLFPDRNGKYKLCYAITAWQCSIFLGPFGQTKSQVLQRVTDLNNRFASILKLDSAPVLSIAFHSLNECLAMKAACHRRIFRYLGCPSRHSVIIISLVTAQLKDDKIAIQYLLSYQETTAAKNCDGFTADKECQV